MREVASLLYPVNTYDAAGRLRREVLNAGATTQFLYDGADLVGEYDAAG